MKTISSSTFLIPKHFSKLIGYGTLRLDLKMNSELWGSMLQGSQRHAVALEADSIQAQKMRRRGMFAWEPQTHAAILLAGSGGLSKYNDNCYNP